MSLSGPYFHAWCDDCDRVDAYAAALKALSTPKSWSQPISVEAAVETARAAFATSEAADGSGSVKVHSGDIIQINVSCWRDEHKRMYPRGPLLLQPDERTELLFLKLQIPYGGVQSVEVEAAVLALITLENIKNLMLRLCAPDETKRVLTGACTWFHGWGPPAYACATYNADANIARDLALSWTHLHDGNDIENIAGLSIETLRKRVEATPQGAHVLVADKLKLSRDKDAVHTHLEMSPPLRITVRGACLDFVGEQKLTRKQVLAVLDTPRNTLLEALETAAVPDKDWQTVEPHAIETIRAKEQGAPTYEKWVNSRAHLLFIEQHAPYHVRRLQNGGVMLATHPYRTLWPLWADALDLLGIRPDKSL